MASAIMHIAVANEIYNKLKDKDSIDYYDYILGSIAPDLNKNIGLDKKESHFIKDNTNIPDIFLFLNKYRDSLDNSFNIGYYIHLYTDKMFYLEFLPLFIKDDILTSCVKCLNGSVLTLSKDERKALLYNDYTNLNISIMDNYSLNLDLFYNQYKEPITNIEEIDCSKLNILIDKMGIIIENSKQDKNYIINISSVKSFIDDCVEEIYDNLVSLGVI